MGSTKSRLARAMCEAPPLTGEQRELQAALALLGEAVGILRTRDGLEEPDDDEVWELVCERVVDPMASVEDLL